MASILGPSNIPPLEAALLGVPVVASDVHKMTDMLSGLKVVPSSNRKAWATAISDLWSNKVAVPKVIPLGEEATLTEAFEFLALQIRGTSR